MAALLSSVLTGGMTFKSTAAGTEVKVSFTQTYDDRTIAGGNAWTEQPVVYFAAPSGESADTTIRVDPSKSYQEYLGMGVSFDESSISNLYKITDAAERDAVLRNLADPDTGAGLNFWRICFGTPDFIANLPFYSYDDVPSGQTDPELNHFSIQKDKDCHIIDVIKKMQEINPELKFFASAWSAPAWMKTNDRFLGYLEQQDGEWVQTGYLKDEYIDAFARYYVKAIQAYQAEGIDISAITLLNEPGMDVVYPAMNLTIPQQQALIKAVKNEFNAAGLPTKLWIHDFNFWDWKDPASTETKNYYRIMEDAQAAAAADGIAFHAYWGDPEVMTDAHTEYSKDVFLTETSVFGVKGAGQIISFFRNWARSYNAWVWMLDTNGKTHHWTTSRDNDIDWSNPNLMSQAGATMLQLDPYTNAVQYNFDYYMVGQFSKYIKEGARRIGTNDIYTGNEWNFISNVAFQNPDGEIVVVVANKGQPRSVKLDWNGTEAVMSIPAGTVATFRWSTTQTVASPEMTPASGQYPEGTVVNGQITCATGGATIKYTTDGTDPRTSETARTGAAPVHYTVTVPAKVRACGTAWLR